jgi:hypothetical protein
MPEPLRFDMILPNGQPLRWDMGPEFRWNGNLPESLTNQAIPMPSNKLISAEMTAAAVTAINGAIATIRTNLPFLISLTNAERRSKAKLGDGRVALDEDAYPLMAQNPTLIPMFILLEEVTKDRILRSQLDVIRLSLTSLGSDIDDTELVLGHEMFKAYLAFYSNAQQAAVRGVAGAQTVVDTLAPYFARPSRNPTPPTPPVNS